MNFKKLRLIIAMITLSAINVFGADVTISSATTGSNLSNNNAGIGQSFQATKTGIIKSISVVFNKTGSDTLNIYEGGGNGAAAIHTQSINFTDTHTGANNSGTYTFNTITLDADVAITSGKTYTFVFATGDQILYDAASYAGGSLYIGPSEYTAYDMVFEVVQGDTPVSNTTPTITGATASQAVNDNATITPFSGITLADADGDNLSVTIALDDNAKGTLSATTIASTSVSDAQTALRAIVFTPTANRVAPGSTETTTFTITLNDGTTNSTPNNTTTVISTSVNDAPTDIALSSTSVNQSGGANASVGTLSTTDVDSTNTHTYSLVSSGTSANETCTSDTNNGSFNINSTTLRANDSGTLSAGTYNVCIQTNDATTTYEKTFTITVTDDVNPTLSTLSPTDNATNIAVDANLVITLSENVTKGTGDILIKKTTDNSTVATIDVTSGLVSISGAEVTINPSSNLDLNTQYYLQIPATAFDDSAGNSYAGITDSVSWSFTTVADTTAPTISDISIPNTPMKVGDTVTATITVTNDSDDYTTGSGYISGYIGGFALGSLSKTNDTTYTATFTVTDGGTDVASGISIPVNVKLTDSAGNQMAIAFTTAIVQASDSIDANKPTQSTISPTLSATAVVLNSDLVLTFSENIIKGTGNIVIKAYSNDVELQTIDVTSAAVIVSGTTATISHSIDFALNTQYYVTVDATAFDDSAGNSFAGISSKDTWKFTSVDNNTPVIGGITTTTTIDDNTTTTPFDSVTITDNESDNVTVTVALDTQAKGVFTSMSLTASGFIDNSDGSYSLASTTTDDAQTQIRKLVFQPAQNRVAVGLTEITTFAITVNDGSSADTDNTTTVTSISINDAPTITSTPITSTDEDSIYSYTLVGDDVDGDDLTWSVKSGTTLPSWLTLGIKEENLKITTFAGNGTAVSDDGIGIAASFNTPNGIEIGFDGNIFVTDRLGHKIRKITPNGIVTTFAGSGIEGSDDAVGTNASFNQPQKTFFDGDVLYVLDSENQKIRKITSDGNVTTFAGSGSFGSNDGNLTSATFNFPTDMVKDSNGNFFITDTSNHLIRKVTPAGDVTTFAGSGDANSTNGNGISASFNMPFGLAIDSKDNLFIADSGNHLIRKITPAGDVTTFAGSGDANSTDGNGTSASFNWLDKLYIDKNDNIYVGDTNNNKIRKVTPQGIVTTLAGTGEAGSIDGDENNATFDGPTDIAAIGDNVFYIAEWNSHKIRKIEIPTVLSGTPTNDDVGDHNISLVLSDGTTTVEHNFTITVNNVNDAPTASDVNITIDEDTSKTFGMDEYNAINFQDVDTNDLFETLYVTSLPSKGRLTLGDANITLNQAVYISALGNVKYTPEANANGTPYTTFGFKVNDGDVNSTSEYTVTINVNSIDDSPTLETISNVIKDEDSNEFNITLNGNDIDSDDIVYTATSSDTSKATVSIVDGKVVVTPQENASGDITVTVKVTASGKTVTQNFTLTLTNINDIPTIDTQFNNITIPEDNGTISYDLNVSDVDGDELNITVESNNTDILTVSPSWKDILQQADYNDKSLDLNISTVKDANGMAKITIRVTDSIGASVSTSFDVTVTPVNDTPTLENLKDKIVYKNFEDINVTLPPTDVDEDILTYTATAINTAMVNIDVVNNNIVTLESIEGKSGNTDVNITVSDNNFTVSKIFNLQILSLEDGDGVEEKGEVDFTEDVNGSTTTVTVPQDNLTVIKKENNDGTVYHEIEVSGEKTKATSNINGTQVKITQNGVSTTFVNSNISLEVDATITGKAIHKLTKDGQTTQASSEIIGAQTLISEDANGSIQIKTSVAYDENTTIEVTAKDDGTAVHKVSKGSKLSQVTSNIQGANTIIKESGEVQTTAGQVDDNNGFYIKAVAITNKDGESITRFIKVSKTDENNITVIGNTMSEDTPFEAGNESSIENINSVLYIKIDTPINNQLIVE